MNGFKQSITYLSEVALYWAIKLEVDMGLFLVLLRHGEGVQVASDIGGSTSLIQLTVEFVDLLEELSRPLILLLPFRVCCQAV